MSTAPPPSVALALPAYDVGRELGRGGFGVVVAGLHRQLGREVAIKQLPPALAVDPGVRSRFVTEARVLAKLDHPHIVPVYDYVEHEGVCLLVMESLPGGTVWDVFQERGLSATTACAITLVTCAGLHYAHDRGVLHRDVKPENLLFNSHGQLKVTDFGIAKVVGGADALATTAGEILGTPAYMAPEQAEGKDLGPPADVFATGAMLYELLSGKLPYSEEGGGLAIVYRHVFEDPVPLRTVAPQVPEQVAEVVMRALARKPEDRYATAEDLGVALGQAATAAYGPGWLEAAEVPVLAGGRILASVDRPTVPAGPQTLFGDDEPAQAQTRESVTAGGAPVPQQVADPRGTLPAGTPATALAAPPPQQGAPTSGDAGATVHVGGSVPITGGRGGSVPITGGGASGGANGGSPGGPTGPAIPQQRVRPSAALHVSGPSAADLRPESLVPVRQVLDVPAFPRATLCVAVALAALTIGAALTGMGDPPAGDRSLAPRAATLQGTDVAAGAPVPVDLAEPLALRVSALPPAAATADTAHLQLSLLGLPLPRSSVAELGTDAGGVRTATLDASASDYLASGLVDADLVLGQGEQELARHRFTAEPVRAPWTTVPGVVSVIALLVVMAYTESLLSPLRRRGRHSVVKTVGAGLSGGAAGALLSVVAAVLGLHLLTVPGLVTAGAAGAATGVALALLMAQAGRRARIRRVAVKLEAARAAGGFALPQL